MLFLNHGSFHAGRFAQSRNQMFHDREHDMASLQQEIRHGPLVGQRNRALGPDADIVDVLDENQIGVDVIQVLYQRAVTAGAEHHALLFITVNPVVGRDGHRIGRRLLHRMIHMITQTVFLLIFRLNLRHFLQE